VVFVVDPVLSVLFKFGYKVSGVEGTHGDRRWVMFGLAWSRTDLMFRTRAHNLESLYGLALRQSRRGNRVGDAASKHMD